MNLRHFFCRKPRNRSYHDAYSIVYLRSGEVGFHCFNCDRTSFHPDDVKEKYCACCHMFIEDVWRWDNLKDRRSLKEVNEKGNP